MKFINIENKLDLSKLITYLSEKLDARADSILFHSNFKYYTKESIQAYVIDIINNARIFNAFISIKDLTIDVFCYNKIIIKIKDKIKLVLLLNNGKVYHNLRHILHDKTLSNEFFIYFRTSGYEEDGEYYIDYYIFIKKNKLLNLLKNSSKKIFINFNDIFSTFPIYKFCDNLPEYWNIIFLSNVSKDEIFNDKSLVILINNFLENAGYYEILYLSRLYFGKRKTIGTFEENMGTYLINIGLDSNYTDIFKQHNLYKIQNCLLNAIWVYYILLKYKSLVILNIDNKNMNILEFQSFLKEKIIAEIKKIYMSKLVKNHFFYHGMLSLFPDYDIRQI
jgi:hypothetical protein